VRKTKRSQRIRAGIICLLLGTIPLCAAPFRLLVIGDSLSEEYRFETPFSAPDSTPFVANANNWVELLHAHRPLSFTMGGYEPSLGNYLDFRNAGYEYNYGIPGFKAERWDELLYPASFNLLDFNTRRELTGDLSTVDAILIFVGGNDLSLAATDEQNELIRQHIVRIHAYVRANAPTGKPIIVATLPDIGATPAEKLTDPVAAAAARQRVATLNTNIAALESLANTYVARIDAITDRIFDQQPFHLNGTIFSYPPDPENSPLRIFCKDGFHPGTAAQALIANEILKAINTFASSPIPLFTNREILSDILAQNPDQPYLDWAGNAGSMTANPDNDALPNLVEFLLANDPHQPDPAFIFSANGAAEFTPDPTALRFADISVFQTSTLNDDWTPVPSQNIQSILGGTLRILPTAPKLFYKFAATPKP
jgi:lysophospholipase L1-like esterase